MIALAFYAWFEQNPSGAVMTAPITPDASVPSVTSEDVRSIFLRVSPRKAVGPDSVPSRALRSHVDQLAEVFTDILNLSLLQAKVPTCFNKTIIIPVPKKTNATCLNDYHPIVLTSIIMKCFGKLVMIHTNSRGEHAPIYINGTEDERVKSIKFLGLMVTDDLSWSSHINATIKKVQYLFFLRWLRKFGMSIMSLTNFYRCTIEHILSGCVATWYGNCSSQDRKKLQKAVSTAQTIMEANLPSMDSICTTHCHRKAPNIIKGSSHP
eukprot:g36370.t1